jgi:hypothetical protein
MSQPAHTPGPLLPSNAVKQSNFGQYKASITRISACPVTKNRQYKEQVASLTGKNQEELEGRTRLLAAAYNAFDSAGRRLGINAVELAEQMQNGGIAELCEVLAKLLGDADHIMYHTPHLEADYFDQARAALAKVKGGTV